MTFHSSIPLSEFVDWLRSASIAGNMPPTFVALVDDLSGAVDASQDIYAAEQNIEDLREALGSLVDQTRANAPREPSDEWTEAVETADQVLKDTKP